MNLKTVVEHFKIPFSLSLSKHGQCARSQAPDLVYTKVPAGHRHSGMDAGIQSHGCENCASSQAPAWEFSAGSSSFLSHEAGASLSGFPSWSLGTSVGIAPSGKP